MSDYLNDKHKGGKPPDGTRKVLEIGEPVLPEPYGVIGEKDNNSTACIDIDVCGLN